MTLQSLLDEAMKLPLEEREQLLAELVERSAREAPRRVVDAWDREIERRGQDLDAGRATLTPWPEARRRLSEDDEG